jgi:hypothetical protein
MLQLPEYPLLGFGRKPIKPVGKIDLPVSLGDLDTARIKHPTFDVVNMYHPYLAIFRREFINKFDVVIRQLFLCTKIPMPKEIITIYGDKKEVRDIEKGHIP